MRSVRHHYVAHIELGFVLSVVAPARFKHEVANELMRSVRHHYVVHIELGFVLSVVAPARFKRVEWFFGADDLKHKLNIK